MINNTILEGGKGKLGPSFQVRDLTCAALQDGFQHQADYTDNNVAAIW